MVVYGIQLQDKQDPGDAIIDVVKNHLATTLPRSAIEICHPLGKNTNNNKRSLIVKFRYRDVKWDIMKKRKLLKKTGIVFAEDLCNEIKTLYEEVRNHKNVDSAWAWNGKIFGKNKSGEIHTIRYGSQWKHLFQDSDPNMNTDELTLEPTATNREESDWKKNITIFWNITFSISPFPLVQFNVIYLSLRYTCTDNHLNTMQQVTIRTGKSRQLWILRNGLLLILSIRNLIGSSLKIILFMYNTSVWNWSDKRNFYPGLFILMAWHSSTRA